MKEICSLIYNAHTQKYITDLLITLAVLYLNFKKKTDTGRKTYYYYYYY